MPKPKGAKTRKANPNKTGPKFTLTDRERVKYVISQYDIKGFSQTQIAAMPDVNVSQATVSNILKELQQDYQDAYVDNRKMWATKATAAHFGVIAEAWEQINKLKQHGKKRSRKESGFAGEKGEFSKDVDEVEDGEIGGYMTIIQKGWMEIAAIQGIRELPAQVFNLQVNNNTVNMFDRFMMEMLNGQGTQGPAPGAGQAEGPAALDDSPGLGAGG